MGVFKEAGETTLIDLNFNGGTEKVLVKEVQVHPVTSDPLHVSFFKVNLTEKIRAEVPVEVVGEEKSPILKNEQGILLIILNEIEVEALPADLPSRFEIDVSHLTEIGEGVTVGELKFDREKVEIVDMEDDELVLKIDYPEMEEEEEEEISEEELVEGVEATEETAEEGGEGESGEEGGEKEEKSGEKEEE